VKTQTDTRRILDLLETQHPDADTELDYKNAYQLLVATILSAQSTDRRVNLVTPALFKKYPTAKALAKASNTELEPQILSTGFFRQKSKALIGMATALVAEYKGEVPADMDALIKLPGVGRKTANVVLGVAFNAPEGVVVDTHVQRISQRLGWTKNTEPVTIEQDLMGLFPRDDWDMLSHVLIFHGRRICTARSPACAACSVSDACPCAFEAENVGRKPPRVRVRLAPKPKPKPPSRKKKKTAKAAKRAKAAKKSARGSR
jgi:endonuclease-3